MHGSMHVAEADQRMQSRYGCTGGVIKVRSSVRTWHACCGGGGADSQTLDMAAQESEGEEAAEARVALPQDMGRGNLAQRQSRVRLQEVPQRLPPAALVRLRQALCISLPHLWSLCSCEPLLGGLPAAPGRFAAMHAHVLPSAGCKVGASTSRGS
jgi:hypothetical protein